jgi:hypothetical protein
MNALSRICLVSLLFLLALSCTSALAQEDDAVWAPTPPRLSFIDGEVSTWRQGADDWAQARPNLALAEGDALYTGNRANFEVQFGSRSFVRADENSELSLVEQDEHRIQFRVTDGRVSFDLRSLSVGDVLEVSTPNAVFVVEHPGYYRVEVGDPDTHFITRRGGEATVTTADGRSLGIYSSEDIVVTAGDPVRVATYAAPAPDDWDRWNDARSDRIGESVSTRYLPPGVYGVEELDHYGRWRMVPAYGTVWIPSGVGPDWVPYSTGYWVWDPYYEWTWVDDAPWGWAPFHYGRWIYIDGYWAWAPGPVVRRPVYSPALVAFLIRDHGVSARISIGLPGVWWVALGWGEPVLPWWHRHRHVGKPRWDGWGGPRIVNNVVVRQTTVIKVDDIHYRNASLPRAVLRAPADRFGRERIRASAEVREREADLVPLRGELPVKPSRASLFGGAPRAAAPPREIVARPVVSTRMPREQAPAWQDEATRARTRSVTESRYVVPPARQDEDRRNLPRPPFGAEAGPERTPPPPPPRYRELKRAAPAAQPAPPRSQSIQRSPSIQRSQPAPRSEAVTREPATVRSQPTTRQPSTVRQETRPQIRPEARPAQPGVAPPAASSRAPVVKSAPSARSDERQRGEAREARKEKPLPGQPANQTYRGREHDRRDAR